MMGLRLTAGIDDAPFLTLINARKRELYEREGLLERLSGRLKTTPRGRMVLTTLTTELMISV